MVEEGSQTHADSGTADEGGGPGDLAVDEVGDADLKGLVDFLARSLVTRPEAVTVDESNDGDTHIFELRVDKEDLGRVIGKQGRTAKSLRTILNAAASRTKTKATLEIIED